MIAISILLFAAGWVGHAHWVMTALNVIYSFPINRTILKLLRLVAGPIIWFGPPLGGVLFGWNVIDGMIDDTGKFRFHPWYAYLALAAVQGGMIYPLINLRRLLRRHPPCVVHESTRTIDVSAMLGGRPIGDGKHRNLAARSWNDIFRVDFTRLELAPARLPPEWDGVTILHLSDLHFYGTPDRRYFETVIAEATREETPDLVVISGDIIDGDEYREWIRPVLSPLRWSTAGLAILGNHDWWKDFEAVRRTLAETGFEVLSNRETVVTLRGIPLRVIGHEGPWFRPAPPDPTGDDPFRLLISHTPDNIGWARRNRIDLMLSGHNHGGQIRVPFIGSIFVPSRFARRYDMGTFHEGGTILHVNRGLSGKEPIRFRCNPQVTRITLRRPGGHQPG